MLNYNEMSKEMLIAHIQTMDMQLEAFTESEYKRRVRIAELERQLQDHSAQAFGIGETYANALMKITELERENSNLRYELNAALSGGTISCPAAASAHALEQQPVAYAIFATYDGIHAFRHAHPDKQSADTHASYFAYELKAEVLPLYAATQAADTDKLREALKDLADASEIFMAGGVVGLRPAIDKARILLVTGD